MGQNQFFSLRLFAVILSQVPFCRISILIWFPVWYKYFTLLMLDHYWGCHWIGSVHPDKTDNFKMFFCSDYHCSSGFLFLVINLFFSFGKYNTKTTCLYNTLIKHVQHALIQHGLRTTHLYNTLIKHENRKIRSFQKLEKTPLKKYNAIQHIIKQAYNVNKQWKEDNFIQRKIHTTWKMQH